MSIAAPSTGARENGAGGADLRACVLTLVVVGTLIRLGLAAVSEGTNDVLIWRHLAGRVSEVGLLEAYRTEPLLNHPPLPVLWAVLALHFGAWFSFVMKLPAIAADALAWVVLARSWLARREPREAWLAALAMALNPVAILISGYHCNTDNVYASLSLLAMYLIEARGSFFLAGLALAGAINVKLIPVLLIPIALSLSRKRGDAGRLVGGLAIGIIPFLPLLAAFEAVKRNMFGYAPPVSEWGIALLLHDLFREPSFARAAKAAMQGYLSAGRWIILAAVVLLAAVRWRTRRWDAYQLGAMVYATFLVLAPGFGPQYTVCVVPLLLATSVSRAWLYSIPAGLFLLLSYGSRLVAWELPLRTLFPPNSPAPPGTPLGLIAWWVLLVTAVQIAGKGGREGVKRET